MRGRIVDQTAPLTRGPARTYRMVGTVTHTASQRDRALYSKPAAVPLAAAARALSLVVVPRTTADDLGVRTTPFTARP